MILSEIVALLETNDAELILDGDSWEVTEGGPTGKLLCSIVKPPDIHWIQTRTFEATAVLAAVVGSENSPCRLRDATDRVGVTAPLNGPKESTGDGLLLERVMMLASENALCRLICEVFRISLPESFMRGLNIAITCCNANLNGYQGILREKSYLN